MGYKNCMRNLNPPRRLASGRVDHELIHQTNPLILTKPYGGGIYASPLPPSTAPARGVSGGGAGLGGLPDPYKTNEKSTFSPSGPPRDQYGSQESARMPLRCSKSVPSASKRLPRAPKRQTRSRQEWISCSRSRNKHFF